MLRIIMRSPFEPPRFKTVDQKQFTTWKTVFLLALASAKRASELHAISRSKRDMYFKKDYVSLRTITGFLAKTQVATCDSKPFKVPAHAEFLSQDMEERLLCPVRMLKYYLRFTGGYLERSRLFFKCKGEGEVCFKTISAWLKKVISYAYENSTEVLQGSVSGHDVRRMAASTAFAAGTSIHDILEAASWKSVTTFICHYLKDVIPQMDGVYRLGPVVAGARIQ